MKLERFIILTYGFSVCFASIVLFVGTLVFVTIKIDSLRREADLPPEPLETLAATPSESRRVYLDEAGKPVVPPAGFELEPSPAVSKPVAVASFQPGVPDSQARLELLRKGEAVGARKAEAHFRSRLAWSQFAVQLILLATSVLLFIFHWRWLQGQLRIMHTSQPSAAPSNSAA